MGGMSSRTTKGLGDRNTVRDGENVDFQSDLEHFCCERNSLLVLRFSSIMYVCVSSFQLMNLTEMFKINEAKPEISFFIFQAFVFFFFLCASIEVKRGFNMAQCRKSPSSSCR